MRWQVSLQLVLGMGALFGLAYFGVERFIGSPLERSALDAADSHAVIGASELVATWERTRDGRRSLVRALAASPTFREGGSERIEAALESATVQMGGGRAAVVRSSGEKIGFGEGAEELANLEATKAALDGATQVRFERIDSVLNVVSVAPVLSSEGRPTAALVLASKFDEGVVRHWMRDLPADVSIALLEDQKAIASTIPARFKGALTKLDSDSFDLEGTRFRTARRAMTDDAGHPIAVVGIGAIQPLVESPIVERVRFLVIALGSLALLLSFLIAMIAPPDSAKSIIEEFNLASGDIPASNTGPIEQMPELDHEPAFDSMYPPPVAKAPPIQPLPLRDGGGGAHPDKKATSVPRARMSEPVPPPAKVRPPSDTRLALDAEKAIKPTPKPVPVAPPTSRSNSGFIPDPPVPPRSRSNPVFAPPDAIPLPGNAQPPPPRAAPLPPPSSSSSSPFDQIAAAAFSAPPPSFAAPAAPPQRIGTKEDDLLMPKGADLDAIAREAAKQGPPRHEPADLPGLKSAFAPTGSIPGSLPRSSSTSGPRPVDLPGLRADDPAARMFDERSPVPRSASNAPRRGSDPWANPALGVYSTSPPVQERLTMPDRIPSNPPAPVMPPPSISQIPTSPPAGPIAYDEEHYRVVYNDFVSSKARLGEAVDNITYEGFRSKLRSSEEALINRHGCRAVRFQVLVKDNTVSLRPQLVR
jgi:hypothetical protein